MQSCVPQLCDTTALLYSRARDRGRRAMRWAALTGRSHRLLALEEVRQGGHVSTAGQSQLEAETRLVPIDQILGSDGRCRDFDRDFHPLRDHNRGRWLGIAAARRQGVPLPPVNLVQVGDRYFVRDGHHRISVARALGQVDIEARVTVWPATGLLPWERQTAPGRQRPSRLLGPETLVGRLYHQVLAYLRTLQPDPRGTALRGDSQP